MISQNQPSTEPTADPAAAVAPWLERAIVLAQREWGRKSERVVGMWLHAAEAAGRSPEEMVDLAQADDLRSLLAESASLGAESSRYPSRVIALGRALAEGLLAESGTVLDHQQQRIDALAAIDRPHLVMMQRMSEVQPHPDEEVHEPAGFVPQTWTQLEALAGEYGESLPRIMATLVREGLVDSELGRTANSTHVRPSHLYRRDGEYWMLNDFGVSVLRLLVEAGGASGVPVGGTA